MAEKPRVGLFATCLVDLLRPSVGFAAANLLEAAGCQVTVPVRQTCCGQPGYNVGDRKTAAAIARQVIDLFQPFDYIVVPSGSCAAMIRNHYPALLADDPEHAVKARDCAQKTWELVSFLTDVMNVQTPPGRLSGTATWHDGCSGLRELGISEQPQRLLTAAGIDIVENAEAETCCGFGGTFCVKYPAISTAMADRKIDAMAATGAKTVLAGDLGCLLNLAGRWQRRGDAPAFRHVAEVLADLPPAPAIGAIDGGDR
jgi:L-lactate dehydrogenase complex protein LldE